MSTGRARGRGRGGGLAAPNTRSNGASTGLGAGRGGRMNGTTRSTLHAPRGGTALRGRGTSFQTGKTLRGNAAKQASKTGAFNNGASTTSGNVEERYTAVSFPFLPQETTDGLRTVTRYSSKMLANENAKTPSDEVSCPIPASP